MANGLSDILSAYRQGLTSERQARQEEMRFALQAMQFEAQERFREEGRQREDVMGALDYAKQSTTQAMGQDASQIYTKISSLRPIVDAGMDAETGALLRTDRIINALSKPTNKKGKYGFTPAQATEIVNIANTYAMAAKNPLLAQSAQDLAVSFGRKVSRDYDIYQSTGFTQSSKFIKSLEKSGLLYKGPDPMQRDMSADVFLGVSDAVTALDNIDKERMEIASGDYKVDTPVTVSAVADADVSGIDFDALATQAGVSLGLGAADQKPPSKTQVDIQNIDLGTTDEDIIQSLDFLDPTMTQEVRSKLEGINENIASKKARLNLLAGEKDELMDEYSSMTESLVWHKKQAAIAEDVGDTKSFEKHSKKAKILSDSLGAEGKSPTSEAAKEYRIGQTIESNPYPFTRKGIKEGWMEKKFNKFFGVPSRKAYESTRGVQILQLSNDIKKLVKQKESLSGR